MSVILQIQKHDRSQSKVYIDKQEYIWSNESIKRFSLQCGMDIDDSTIMRITLDSQLCQAYERALFYLDYGAHSQQQMRLYLEKKGFSLHVIENVIKRLIQNGLLDNREYGRMVLENANAALRGKRAISQMLYHKGIRGEMQADLLSGLLDEQQLLSASCFLKKKMPSFRSKGHEGAKLRQKCFQSLVARGYEYDIAKQAANEAIGKEDEDYDE